MSRQRRRRWANTKPALVKRLVFAGLKALKLMVAASLWWLRQYTHVTQDYSNK